MTGNNICENDQNAQAATKWNNKIVVYFFTDLTFTFTLDFVFLETHFFVGSKYWKVHVNNNARRFFDRFLFCEALHLT